MDCMRVFVRLSVCACVCMCLYGLYMLLCMCVLAYLRLFGFWLYRVYRVSCVCLHSTFTCVLCIIIHFRFVRSTLLVLLELGAGVVFRGMSRCIWNISVIPYEDVFLFNIVDTFYCIQVCLFFCPFWAVFHQSCWWCEVCAFAGGALSRTCCYQFCMTATRINLLVYAFAGVFVFRFMPFIAYDY